MVERARLDELVDQEWQKWLEQKRVRLAKGDDLTAERRVEHVLYFRRRLDARRARIAINKTRAVRLLRTDGHPRWILEATAPEDLHDESVRHSLSFMLTIALMCQGTYDGFGAPIVRGKGATSSRVP